MVWTCGQGTRDKQYDMKGRRVNCQRMKIYSSLAPPVPLR
uniref:Uncharacterized protein n=1 Tax=Anguilla anguilla TaxID=7936 RepID=A0A0E9Q1G1_ANGAN